MHVPFFEALLFGLSLVAFFSLCFVVRSLVVSIAAIDGTAGLSFLIVYKTKAKNRLA